MAVNMCGMVAYGLLVLLCVSLCCAQEQDQGQRQHVVNITAKEYEKFKNQPLVRMLYFAKQDTTKRLKTFYNEYEKSATVLSMYNVKFGRIDCAEHNIKEYCEKKNAEDFVYAFRDGLALLELSLDTMFDVNSIVSNVLQIVLLREVPILQSKEERIEYENKHKGQYNVIFSFQKAIGTYSHRILMEVAYAYQGSFKFAITTEKGTVADLPTARPWNKTAVREVGGTDIEGDAGLWMLKCKELPKNSPEPCPAVMYYDRMDLVSLARYARALTMPSLVVDATPDITVNPFAESDLHTVFYFHTAEDKEFVQRIANHITTVFLGLVGVLLVDPSKVDPTQYGYKFESHSPPMIAAKLRDQDDILYMTQKISEVNVETFIGEGLAKYIDPAMDKDQGQVTEEPEYSNAESLEQVEKQDDQVADAVWKMRNQPLDFQHVPELTDKTFYKATKNPALLVVLYYIRFDARSMAFLRSYLEASLVLANEGMHPLASIECYDWTDVCGKENITTYPTIRIFRNGDKPMVYSSLLDGAAIIKTVKLLKAPAPVLLKSSQEVHSFLKGQQPADIGQVTNTSVLGLMSTDNQKELAAFKEAAQQAHGKLLFGLATDQVAAQIASQYSTRLPSVIVFKRDDALQPHSVYRQEMTVSRIIQFAQQARLQVFPELNAINFPSYFSRKQPLAILFAKDPTGGSSEHGLMGDLAKSADNTHVTFCWMDVTVDDSIAYKVLKEYGNGEIPMLPALVVVNHQKGSIHLYPGNEYSKESVSSWLQGVLQEKVPVFKPLPEGDWKPLNPGYDFLKMIDDAAAGKKEPEDDEHLKVANEQGIEGNLAHPASGEDVKVLQDSNAEEETRNRLHRLRVSQPMRPPISDDQHAHQTKHTEL